MTRLTLKYGLQFKDLYTLKTLEKLDVLFQETLSDPLKHRLQEARKVNVMPSSEESILLLELAPYLESFLTDLFDIKESYDAIYQDHLTQNPIIKCKVDFVRRRVMRGKEEKVPTHEALRALDSLKAIIPSFSEQTFASAVLTWLENSEKFASQLESAEILSRWGYLSEDGRQFFKDWVLFDLPRKVDLDNLIPVKEEQFHGQTDLHYVGKDFHLRSGFNCTDPGVRLNEAQDQAAYCIWCHDREKDSCSKGLKDPKTGKNQSASTGVELGGCPLDQKISEMNKLKAHGHFLGAVAVAMIDNPLLAATGHRICNDCAKACIYQKQTPVDIPKIETQAFESVLNLPWGFEIYALLTRWNPLNRQAPLPKPDSGHKVLVAGMGPAGFTLAHYLLREGHTVVGIDGLKIEPMEDQFILNPLESIEDLRENLSERVIGGFGGVAEYGITVRWDKNNLKIIRLLLERHRNFRLYGGIRLGSNLTLDQAYDLGFGHISLCMGAGRPNIIFLKNGLAKGVRLASDFLMALQLTGAFKEHALANLQIRLPAVIVGGGLTAIDTASEVMAYYPVQVKRFAKRYAELLSHLGLDEEVRQGWEPEDHLIADEFLRHASEIILEEEAAARQNRPPDLLHLVQRWGGVRIVYRKDLKDAPSYKLNHEEVFKALQEGVSLIPHQEPLEVVLDEFEAAKEILCTNSMTGEETLFPAKSIFIAAGIHPNIMLAKEYPGQIKLAGRYFQAVNEDGFPLMPDELKESDRVNIRPLAKLGSRVRQVLGTPGAQERSVHEVHEHLSTEVTTQLSTGVELGKGSILLASDVYKDRLSFFGDLHPEFVGNVVKAKASAKKGYPLVTRALQRVNTPAFDQSDFFKKLDDLLETRIEKINRLAPKILEIVVRSRQAARNFKPGQFYRFQNFETFAPVYDGVKLLMEGIALTGAEVNPDEGLISLIVLETGVSSDLCRFLKVGEPVVLMGPTGSPTEIPTNETVLLAGGGLGNAVLFSIGKAMREKGCRVLYFAAYKSADQVFKREKIEEAADRVIWCAESGEIPVNRRSDRFFKGNIVQALHSGEHGGFEESDRVLTIGSDRMMSAVYDQRALFPAHTKMIGSINSPMQCMMKEICAQCLQKHRDPITGEESYVFSCVNQDQSLNFVDFNHLSKRLTQNRLSEKLTHAWLKLKLEGSFFGV